ncbi:MAG: helix-turn-helix transcriptional regulator [Halobacteriota archaeon]
MLGEGSAIGLPLFANAVAQAGMDDPMTGTALFVGVLTGLLLVSFLVGRRLSEPSPDEDSPSTTTRIDGASDPSNGTASTGGPSDSPTETPLQSRPEPTVEWSTGDGSRDLDDDERVLAMLEDSDGQLRQSRIVSESGWSKTKVSRTLSGLAEDGDVVKIQLGRENLICLPEQVPSIGQEEDR